MSKERYPYIDLLRVASMLGVIVLHSASYGLRGNYFSPTWQVLNVITAISTCAVPLFFMISGALLLSDRKTENPPLMLKRRLPKVILPLIFWSLACIARDFYYIKKNLHVFDPGQLWDTLVAALEGPAAVHLWFMYALIPIYLAAPFIKRLVDSDRLMKYLLGLWLLACGAKTGYMTAPEGIKELFNIGMLNKLNYIDGYVGYFVMGYYLHSHGFRLRKRLSLPAIAGMTGVISLGTLYATDKLGEYSEMFKSYTTIWVIALSCLLFIAAMGVERLPGVIERVTDFFAPLSLGIYLSGNFFLGIMRQEGMTFDTAIGFIKCNIYTILLCTVCIWILKQIPVIRFIATGNKGKKGAKVNENKNG